MNKADLIQNVAVKTGLTKKDTEKTINALMDSIQGVLVKGDKLTLVGFGTFEVKSRAARTGRNPQNGAKIDLPEIKAPVFKAGKALKDAVQ